MKKISIITYAIVFSLFTIGLGFFIAAGIVFSTPIAKKIAGRLENTKASYAVGVLKPVAYGIIFLWAVSYIILGAHNPFIYFNF